MEIIYLCPHYPSLPNDAKWLELGTDEDDDDKCNDDVTAIALFSTCVLFVVMFDKKRRERSGWFVDVRLLSCEFLSFLILEP